jgi:hypothetical protein
VLEELEADWDRTAAELALEDGGLALEARWRGQGAVARSPTDTRLWASWASRCTGRTSMDYKTCLQPSTSKRGCEVVGRGQG